jgi:hypothetical protein
MHIYKVLQLHPYDKNALSSRYRGTCSVMSISRYFGTENTGDEAVDAAFASSASFNQPFTHNVPFQLPPFMFTGPPAVAPGGGAEVIQSNVFATPHSSWHENAGLDASCEQ